MTTSGFLRGTEHKPVPRSAHPAWDAVFLDRDGTINQLLPGYRTPEDFSMLDGAAQAVADINAQGVPVILVTNQQGLATGDLSWGDLEEVHRMLVQELAEAGAHLDDIRLCPHLSGTCECRKPLPGLLLTALRDYPWLSPGRTLMIGDSYSDLQAAAAAGVHFRSVDPTFSLLDAVRETFR